MTLDHSADPFDDDLDHVADRLEALQQARLAGIVRIRPATSI
jgi:hypothetical protein